MSSLMYAQMGMAAGQSLFQAGADDLDYKIKTMTQKYNNTMRDISTAQSLNALTENEISVRDAAVQASQSIQVQSMQDTAGATVSAAAAGVRGSSVDAAMRGLVRSRMQANEALKARLQGQARSDLSNRRNLLMSAAYSKDVSVISKPSTASALLGLGARMIDIYDQNQPEGSRTTDTIAGWGR